MSRNFSVPAALEGKPFRRRYGLCEEFMGGKKQVPLNPKSSYYGRRGERLGDSPLQLVSDLGDVTLAGVWVPVPVVL